MIPTISRLTKPAYPGHWPVGKLENLFLAAGSAVVSLVDVYRHDMLATLTETSTPTMLLQQMRQGMLSSDNGRRILAERPRISTKSVDLDALRDLPKGTLGREYSLWLERCGVTPDTRDPVHYIDDEELAYIVQRYRESHDLYHLLLGQRVDILSELIIKWFEFSHFKLPVAGLSSAFGPLRLRHSWQRQDLFTRSGPWAIRQGNRCAPLMGIYWENEWSTNLAELRQRMNLTDVPDWRDGKGPQGKGKAKFDSGLEIGGA
ncbi:coenzyme Q biosynthesis Coq4 [Wallemia mellicola]|uniref:4-hydroxy-3-methoxy-5-polyprenylbenzoate decarboxylase n=1 Tax=Wallemia mellicola TaxID=1708541 RepID=A0A4T0M0M6_9BASI|nr:coenzyme Q biosynthesis Coq4 [Wallemia mellicola]TIB87557.1 coenzyme Q biosynthesis Coq4 [Wallemia mellicola]TIC01336.1 coenzyme Q biosynthesis Coq4 [Wallemia mellicola]TIC13760.1 coenzyme Q biosynthesis Coq4 [Wallemia mellicola]